MLLDLEFELDVRVTAYWAVRVDGVNVTSCLDKNNWCSLIGCMVADTANKALEADSDRVVTVKDVPFELIVSGRPSGDETEVEFVGFSPKKGKFACLLGTKYGEQLRELAEGMLMDNWYDSH